MNTLQAEQGFTPPARAQFGVPDLPGGEPASQQKMFDTILPDGKVVPYGRRCGGNTMRLLFSLVLSFVLVGAALQTAEAQRMFARQWETNVSLGQDDIDMIRGTLNQKIHGRQAGTSATWSNPGSGNSGTLTLVRVFERRGQRCEQIDYQIRSSRPGRPSDRYDLTSCLQPNGAWMLSY